MRSWPSLIAALPVVFLASAVAAQPPDDQPTADLPPAITLAYVDGRAEIARDTGVDPAQAPDVLDAGDRLLTHNGRAELVFADGTVVHVDAGSDLRVDDALRLRIDRGRIIVRTSAAATAAEIATPVGAVQLEPRGEYEIAARDLDGETTIAALAGRATLMQGAAPLGIGAGDEVGIDPRRTTPRWARAVERPDAFADWAAARVNDTRTAAAAQPLPVELAAYAPMFSTYGWWDTLAPYGAVWYPAVGPDWRPYSLGGWRYTRFGWTWIDAVPWGWPVHHYGRWGHHAHRGWYWIPRRTWGPAWVGWAVHADYVGWAPLGWNSRPAVDFFVGARIGSGGLWAGTWSIVPRGVFGRRGPYGRHFADVRRLPGPVLGGFVVQDRAPFAPHGWSRRLVPAPRYGRPVAVPRRSVTRDRAPWTGARDRAQGPSETPAPDAVPRRRGWDGTSPTVIDYTARGGRRGSATAADAEAAEPASTREAAPAGTPRWNGLGQRPPDAGPWPVRSARDPRAWRSPAEDDANTREVSPRRPSDPRGTDAEGAGGRARAAPRRPAPEYGRPTPSTTGRAWGRPDGDESRPRAGGGGQARPRTEGSAAGRVRGTGGGSVRGSGGSAGSRSGGVTSGGGGGRSGGRRAPR